MNKKDMPVSFPQEGVAGTTGSWRSVRPQVNMQKCIHCQRCWIFCPDACVDRESVEINYTYCKGCGICAAECPADAIAMVPEVKCE